MRSTQMKLREFIPLESGEGTTTLDIGLGSLNDFPPRGCAICSVMTRFGQCQILSPQSILSSPDYDRTTPVTTMPMGLDMNLTNYRENRQRFNFPGGTTVFLVMFDFLSSFHRKNPLAALAAFRSAFEAQEGSPKVLLVIKCLLPKGGFCV